MISNVIDVRIRKLVNTMNACGFKTFASCEGHGFPVDSRLPYVAFYSPLKKAASLEDLLRGDAESSNPQLNWGWTITGSFSPTAALGFTMRPTRPHFILHRYLRYSIIADFGTLDSLLYLNMKNRRD